jgi:hypothetical protein
MFEIEKYHPLNAVLKFAMPFYGKPRWAALMTGITLQIQELENVVFDVLFSRKLANASGVRLQTLARLVGQAVLDYDDTTLRKLIRVRIAINRSEGRWDDLLKILDRWDDNISYTLSPLYPAALRLDLNTADASTALMVKTFVPAVAAGVNLVAIGPALGVAFPFLFKDANSFTDDANAGFADANAAPTDRGLVSTVYPLD